ncbi:hypothetical protein NBRC3188_2912 [Acetobacter pasteurianus NBRC 3188]|uniref:Uncharacterized protein n=1 Tax=Acetobacter pasteurianus NBRC 3188 TaxID=1226663 RepID=A0A401WY58_ACEPA|nr:hypothetical protein NBRC3188_2912 [Acetobacter pasteurianus NBRC 3188]
MKDIEGGIVIGIGVEAACRADEGRLVLAASTVHGSTARTRLRCKARVYLHDTMGFVEKQRFDLVPAHVENGAVESALLCDVSSGFLHGSGGTGGHVSGTQSLDNRSSVVPADVGCRFVRPVLADTSGLCLECCNALASKGVTVRTPLATRENALCLTRPSLDDFKPLRQHVSRAIGEHERHGHATINADCTLGRKVSDVTVLATDTDLPSEGREADGRFRQFARQVPRHAELDPAYLRQTDTTPSVVQALNGYLTSVEGEGIVHAFLLRFRIAAKTLEEAAISIVQRLKRVLLAGLTNGADKVCLAAERRQFSRLRHVVQVVAGSGLIVPPVFAALLKSKIPHKTADARELKEGFLLQGVGLEPVCETTKRHAINLIWKPRSVKGGTAFLPGVNAEVSSGV